MNQSILLLERLGTLIHQSVREDAARHGLLPIHVQVLGYLVRANNYSNLPIAVAEYFGITRGTVSQTLAVLERKGLIRKEAGKLHGKRLHLSLTPAGRLVLKQSWTKRLGTALASPTVDPDTLEETLRNILTGLQQLNGRRPFGICHECAHFLQEKAGSRCGLTGEPLVSAQTRRICREWTALVRT